MKKFYKRAYVCTSFKECDTNSYILTQICNFLKGNDIQLVKNADESNIIIIGTCAATETKENEAINFIKPYIQKYNHEKKIVICGCLPKINPLLNKEKNVIAIGPRELDKFNYLFNSKIPIQKFKANVLNQEFCFFGNNQNSRYYIEIGKGCINNCSYCVIKKAKGNVKSYPIKETIEELKNGLQQGFKKFVLLADDCGSYGLDIGTDFSKLLHEICTIKKNKEDFELIISYFEPNTLIELYQYIRQIIPKLNISTINLPLQSGNNRILKLMNRDYKVEDVIKSIKDIKRISPNTKIYTHIICCFPSETREEFLDSIHITKFFDKASFFFYSDREGTPASNLKKKVSKKEYNWRAKYLDKIVKENPIKYRIDNPNRMTKSSLDLANNLHKRDMTEVLESNNSLDEKKEKAVEEKKKWISLTGLCNNSCIFCLDGDRTDRFHKSEKEIKKEIDEGIKEKATRLVLSGGEPTIHPKILEFIKYGKQIGYKKIQIITNGRMLAYKSFVQALKEAGLDEITFSLHGHRKEIHEGMTRVQGSFAQIVRGIKNALEAGFIVNSDTTITKINYKYLPKILEFVHSLGINEVNLMSIVPFGNAWKNKKEVIYKFDEIVPYVNKAVDFCKSKGIFLWFSRFPAEYLEGYEEYTESPKKILEDVLARGEDFFKKQPDCLGERCEYCGIKTVCKNLVNGSYIKSIPQCLSSLGMNSQTETVTRGSKSFKDFASEVCMNARVKRLACHECMFNGSCEGILMEEARKEGFGVIKPITQK